LLIVIAGLVVALAVALVLVISAWVSDGGSGTGSAPTPVTLWPCDRTGPC
jgi:hypothetical protein